MWTFLKFLALFVALWILLNLFCPPLLLMLGGDMTSAKPVVAFFVALIITAMSK